MISGVIGNAQANSRDLCIAIIEPDINARHTRFPKTANPIFCKQIDQRLLDSSHKFFDAAAMPGVYVRLNEDDAKIAAIGLRIANHATYHGLSLNVDMDLTPFMRINPCGYEGLAVTQMRDCGVTDKMDAIAEKLTRCLQHNIYGL